MDQLETAILADVVTRFVNLRESTSRFSLLVRYEGQPAWQAIGNLKTRNLLRIQPVHTPTTTEEEYVPTAFSFELCGIRELRETARTATGVVLYTLKQMFKGEPKRQGLTLADLQHHVERLFANQIYDSETLKLGLYLATDFHVINASYSNPPDINSFHITEAAITIANPQAEWDRVMAAIRPDQPTRKSSSSGEDHAQWERVERLGGGGQSDVFIVRSPERVSERENCLVRMRVALASNNHAEFADAAHLYSRQESVIELGALKVFKIPLAGAVEASSDSQDYESIKRLTNEITVLAQGRAGLPKLLASDVAQRWIVTELFPEGTLEKHPHKFRGNARSALTAFRSLVQTVALLHKDGYVHRDIKPANVFVRKDDELVLGDFGIVFVADLADRVTVPDERVGPRDYMPQWAYLGARNEKVEPCIDVYMLGKLLWSIVDGRKFLPREYHHEAEFDVTLTFPNDPDMFLINRLLDKCVVERSSNCLSSAHDLGVMVEGILATLSRGGQLLSEKVPRPCHVCGTGFYQVHRVRKESATAAMRLWMSGAATDIEVLGIQLFACDSCGNIQFFKT